MKTTLEAVLQAMVTEGWANESDGHVDSPEGHFARISNSEAEALGTPGGVCEAFRDVIDIYATEHWRDSDLIGHFLVVEDSQGNVSVTEYDNPIALTRDYLALQDAYAEWVND